MMRALSLRPVWTRLSLVLCAIAAGSARAEEGLRVTVRGNGHDLGETPIVAELKTPIPPGHYVLRPAGDESLIPANVFKDGGKMFLGVVLDKVRGDKAEIYALQPDE